MKNKLAFALNALGWFLLLLALTFGGVRRIGLDPGLYYQEQLKAGVQDTAGLSEEDLLMVDVWLANYLEGKYDSPNGELSVYGTVQPIFNEKELQHLEDCRRLFAPVVSLPLNCGMAIAGVALALYGERKRLLSHRRQAAAVWLASGVILLPVALLGLWALVDFQSAFTFFHKLLFTNDLWLLDPATDLLIRICPQSMFMYLGGRIGVYAALMLLGAPALCTLLAWLDSRRNRTKEVKA